jgi:hypothetical protein
LSNLPNHGASHHALGVVGKFSMNKGVSSWFHNVSTCSEEVIEKKNSLKIHLNKKNYNGIWANSWYC